MVPTSVASSPRLTSRIRTDSDESLAPRESLSVFDPVTITLSAPLANTDGHISLGVMPAAHIATVVATTIKSSDLELDHQADLIPSSTPVVAAAQRKDGEETEASQQEHEEEENATATDLVDSDEMSMPLVDAPSLQESDVDPLTAAEQPVIGEDGEENSSQGESSGEDESSSEESDDDEEEPTLKYSRLNAGVVEILEKDSVSSLAVSSKFIVRCHGSFLSLRGGIDSLNTHRSWARTTAPYLSSTSKVSSTRGSDLMQP